MRRAPDDRRSCSPAGIAADARQQAPTFRTSTLLIVQTVVVKDKKGSRSRDSPAKDFVVTEDGQPQTIAFVEYQRLDAAPLSALTMVTTPSGAPVPTPPATWSRR